MAASSSADGDVLGVGFARINIGSCPIVRGIEEDGHVGGMFELGGGQLGLSAVLTDVFVWGLDGSSTELNWKVTS